MGSLIPYINQPTRVLNTAHLKLEKRDNKEDIAEMDEPEFQIQQLKNSILVWQFMKMKEQRQKLKTERNNQASSSRKGNAKMERSSLTMRAIRWMMTV